MHAYSVRTLQLPVMGITAAEHRLKVGNFNSVQASRLRCPPSRKIKSQDFRVDSFSISREQNFHPELAFLAYGYIMMLAIMFAMYIDTTVLDMVVNYRIINFSLCSNTADLRNLINYAFIIILLLKSIPNQQICVYRSMKNKSKINNINILNFCYHMFLRDSKTSIYYLMSLNLIMIVITTPSIVNPGPNTNCRPLNIFYNNVQGFINPGELKSNSPNLNMKKMHEFNGYILSNKPDIVILNETWLKKSILDSEVLPKQCYKIFRTDRSGKTHPWDPNNPKKYRKHGGGILIGHRLDIDIESTEVSSVKALAEILTINFKLPSGKKLNISTFYRVGNLGLDNFESVKKYLTTLATKKKLDKHILIGDLNFPEISWPDPTTSVELHRKFIDLLMLDLNHSQLVDKPTHKNGNILDLLFTNIPEQIKEVTVLGYKEACSSDHFGINFKLSYNVSRKKFPKRTIFNFGKANWKNLNFELKKVNWNDLIGMHDPNDSWKIFKTIVNNLCEKYIPKKSIKYQFQPPWFDSDCERILREKEKWRAKYNSPSGTDEDHKKFCQLRSDFKKIMDEKMRLNVEDETDPALISKKFWKHVKSKTKSTRIPETVWYKDRFRTNPLDQANLFNEYFSDQFSDKSQYSTQIDMDNNNSFIDLKFHELDVLLLLRKINPSKAAGPDGLHGMILKNCAPSLAKPLTILFNISFVSGIIPDDWKLASVVPVHKKDEKGSVENYRPISLTSLVMKVFERCIRKELFEVCEPYLDPRQHGFVNSKSCTTQLVPFIYDLTLTLNNKSKSDIIYFDFAKAFDSVSHDIILQKLKNKYNIDGLMLRFIKSYLEGRKQQVVVGGVTSSTLPVESGVPQGSILGPLLFVIFINDMFSCISEETKITLYADDTKIWRDINVSNDHFILQNDIDKLQTWAVINKMKFHPSKCKALSVTNQQNILHNLPFTIFNYKLDSEYIDYVNSQNDLGVTVNNKLSWKEQCDKLVNKASSKLGLLMRTCHFTIDKKQKRTFYLTIVRSIFEHSSILWHPLSSNQIFSFDAIQKRAIKWILGQRFDHYSEDEYLNRQKELNILPIKLKFYLNDLVLFYKILYKLVAINLPNDFEFMDGNQLRYTRKTSAIINEQDKTQIKCKIKTTSVNYRNFFFFRSMVVWNKIPYNIRQAPCISTFKTGLVKYLWEAHNDWPD